MFKLQVLIKIVMLIPHRPNIPPEVLDHTVDFLHDDQEALKKCCIASKSWIPRTRTHLFARIELRSAVKLELWKRMFPDNSNSPAHHTHTLLLRCPEVATAADAGDDSWIHAFSRVTQLLVQAYPTNLKGLEVSLIPFRRFSPILKSLCLYSSSLQNSQIFDLISTLPHLEDLALTVNGIRDDASNFDAPPAVGQPSPAFTGTLHLAISGKIEPIVRWLLGLPDGLHFRKLVLSRLDGEDLQSATALVAGCLYTLECLVVTYQPGSAFILLPHFTSCPPSVLGGSCPISIDLSKATKLRDVSFLLTSLSVEYVTQTLQTLTPEHQDFRQISINVPYRQALSNDGVGVGQAVGEPVYNQWLELDRLLIQLWDSRSIRPKISYFAMKEERRQMAKSVGYLLPRAAKEEILDLVEWLG